MNTEQVTSASDCVLHKRTVGSIMPIINFREKWVWNYLDNKLFGYETT